MHTNQIIKLLILLLLPLSLVCQQLLSGVPLSFNLLGNVNYIPSSGGVAIPGYSLSLSFRRYSWVGVMFMTTTSYSNQDVLIFQRSSTPSSGAYTVSVGDYYVSSGRPSSLMTDSVSSMDLQASNTTSSDTFTLSMYRTKGNTNGQDWEGGDFVQLCFFTSDAAFSVSSWAQQYQSCYGFDVSSGYISTFQGFYLGNMQIDGVSSQVYGGILGPYLQLQLYFYRPSATMTNTSNLIIRIGDMISSTVGYDYFVCSNGDYYGTDTSSLLKDLSYSGYDNGLCSTATGSSSYKISFLRDVNTYDSFDWTITTKTNICIIGSTTNCGSFTFSPLYPQMSVGSALSVGQGWIYLQLTLLIASCLLMAS